MPVHSHAVEQLKLNRLTAVAHFKRSSKVQRKAGSPRCQAYSSASLTLVYISRSVFSEAFHRDRAFSDSLRGISRASLGRGARCFGTAMEEGKVAILTTLGCQFCKQTKSELSKAGIGFQEYDLSRQLDVLKKAKELTGRSSVPQVFINGELIGGSEETIDLLHKGKLQERIDKAEKQPLPSELQDIVKGTSAEEQERDVLMLPEGVDLKGYEKLHAAVRRSQSGGISTAKPSSSSFTWQELLQWCQDQELADSSEAAETQAKHLLTLSFVGSSGGHVQERDGTSQATQKLHWLPDKPEDRKSALNSVSKWEGQARSASEIAEGLRQITLQLFEKHLSEDGKGVAYQALAEDPIFHLFVRATTELQAADISPLSREERIAFFLNTYNVLIVHALTLLGPARNFFERLGWFGSIKYDIGGLDYSADDIEHGILRGNRPTAGAIPVLLGHPEWSSGYFKKGDPRLKQVVQDMDKRIHFALNCGAKSCPPIKLFSPDTLEEGLQSGATAFLQGDVHVDMDENVVWLSKIFKWYYMDFGSQEALLRWLLPYLNYDNASALERLLQSQSAITVKHNEYDWGQNSA